MTNTLLSAGRLRCAAEPGDEAGQILVRRAAQARGGGFPGLDRATEGAWSGPFFFIQIADPQFGMIDRNQSWEKEEALFSRAVQHVNRLRPRFVVVTGDQVNELPGSDAYLPQVAAFHRLAAQIDPGIPVVWTAGNHDVGDCPTPAMLSSFRRYFGDDWYGFWVGGVRFLVIDTNLYWDPSGAPEEQERQDAWFMQELAQSAREAPRHLIVLQHHPWFLKQPDEPNQYWTIPGARRGPALAAMQRAGVRAAFAGHYHRNAAGWAGYVEMVATSAVCLGLGEDPPGIRIVQLYEDRLVHKYYGLDGVPDSVTLQVL